MDLTSVVEAVVEDLRRTSAIGGEETARVANLLVGGLDASLRLHVLEAVHAAATEIEAAVPGLGVDVRLDGREAVLTVSHHPEPGEGPPDARNAGAAADYADDELLRLTIRLPEGLKAAVEQAAAAGRVSINSWIVSALARAVDASPGHQGPGRAASGRRLPRRMTAYVQG